MPTPSKSASRPWALITGASEGLGKEFALQLARRQTHNLIFAARSVDKLNAVAKTVSEHVECKVIKSDLSVSGAAEKLDRETSDLDVALLINNAGVAFGGAFEDMPFGDVQALVAINIVALTELFSIFLRRIKQQHKKLSEQQKESAYALTGIINVASTAGFMPIPSMALYAASKAFVTSLTEAVYAEQRNEGSDLRVVVSCPGATKTEIWTKGGAHEKSLRLPMGTSEHVCATTLAALEPPTSLSSSLATLTTSRWPACAWRRAASFASSADVSWVRTLRFEKPTRSKRRLPSLVALHPPVLIDICNAPCRIQPQSNPRSQIRRVLRVCAPVAAG